MKDILLILIIIFCLILLLFDGGCNKKFTDPEMHHPAMF